MRYRQRTTKNIKENFFKELMIDRGKIPANDEEYCKRFMKPTKDNLLNNLKFDNIERGFSKFKERLLNGEKFLIVVDPDFDGFSSAAVLYNYMTKDLKEKFPKIEVEYHIPEGKEHGLEMVMDNLTQRKKYDMILLPDSSSNDYEYHKILRNMGYDILVLDHHEAEKYSEDAIVINNQLSKNYENKSLSGVGVVYKFLKYCDEQFNIDKADKYLDLVAAGMCGDMMNLNTLENRYLVDYGFSHIRNASLRGLVSHQSYSIFAQTYSYETLPDLSITPIQCSFYIAPLVNALIRVGTILEKEKLFLSFVDGEKIVESTKRGHKGEKEYLAEQNARNCANARAKQNREKDKALELLDIQILNNNLNENKILILNADNIDVSTTLTGLCAMGVAAKYKKPVILGRLNSEGYLKGSIRGQNDSELKDFKGFLKGSGYMNFVEG